MKSLFDDFPMMQYVRIGIWWWILILIVLSAVCIKWPVIVLCVLLFRAAELWVTARLLSDFRMAKA